MLNVSCLCLFAYRFIGNKKDGVIKFLNMTVQKKTYNVSAGSGLMG